MNPLPGQIGESAMEWRLGVALTRWEWALVVLAGIGLILGVVGLAVGEWLSAVPLLCFPGTVACLVAGRRR